MKQVDRWLQQWRIAKALPFLDRGARVLDIGCGEGELLRRVAGLADGSIGVDPTLSQASHRGAFRLVRGIFPDDVPANAGPFDAVTMLAVIEHLNPASLVRLFQECHRVLAPSGVVVLTTPVRLYDSRTDAAGRAC